MTSQDRFAFTSIKTGGGDVQLVKTRVFIGLDEEVTPVWIAAAKIGGQAYADSRRIQHLVKAAGESVGHGVSEEFA